MINAFARPALVITLFAASALAGCAGVPMESFATAVPANELVEHIAPETAAATATPEHFSQAQEADDESPTVDLSERKLVRTTELQVRDCIVLIEPLEVGDEVNEVQLVSCGSKWDYRVVSRIKISGVLYRGTEALLKMVADGQCGGTLPRSAFVPSKEEWDEGFREIVCLDTWNYFSTLNIPREEGQEIPRDPAVPPPPGATVTAEDYKATGVGEYVSILDLEVGDCFQPSVTGSWDVMAVVYKVDCSKFWIFKITRQMEVNWSPGAAYPGSNGLSSYRGSCPRGSNYLFYPAEDAWDEGLRTVMCAQRR